jgi:hypothetical protein
LSSRRVAIFALAAGNIVPTQPLSRRRVQTYDLFWHFAGLAIVIVKRKALSVVVMVESHVGAVMHQGAASIVRIPTPSLDVGAATRRPSKVLMTAEIQEDARDELVREGYCLVAASHWRQRVARQVFAKWRHRPEVRLRTQRYARLSHHADSFSALCLQHRCLRLWTDQTREAATQKAKWAVATNCHASRLLRMALSSWYQAVRLAAARRRQRNLVSKSNGLQPSPLALLFASNASRLAHRYLLKWRTATARSMCVSYLQVKCARALLIREASKWLHYARRRRVMRASVSAYLLKWGYAASLTRLRSTWNRWFTQTLTAIQQREQRLEQQCMSLTALRSQRQVHSCFGRWRVMHAERQHLKGHIWSVWRRAFTLAFKLRTMRQVRAHRTTQRIWKAWRDVHITEAAQRALLVVSSSTLQEVAAAGHGSLPVVNALTTVGIPTPMPPLPLGLDITTTRSSSAAAPSTDAHLRTARQEPPRWSPEHWHQPSLGRASTSPPRLPKPLPTASSTSSPSSAVVRRIPTPKYTDPMAQLPTNSAAVANAMDPPAIDALAAAFEALIDALDIMNSTAAEDDAIIAAATGDGNTSPYPTGALQLAIERRQKRQSLRRRLKELRSTIATFATAAPRPVPMHSL